MDPELNNNLPEIITAAVSSQQKSNAKSAYAPFLLPGAILIAALIVSGTLLFTRSSSKGTAQIGGAAPTPAAKVDVKVGPNDQVLGNADAKVTIVEFSDFQCPFCRSFWSGAFAEIKKNYVDTGKAKIVYRHFPLSFHAAAHVSAQAVECAGDQGKFWELHDKIFQEQEKQGQGTIQFTKADVVKWAGQIGLNMSQFNSCVDSEKYSQKVDDDIAYGSSLGVSGTPTTFVNGQRIVGAQSFATFQAAIDALLK